MEICVSSRYHVHNALHHSKLQTVPAFANSEILVLPCDFPADHGAALYEKLSFAIALVFAGSLSDARTVEAALVTNYREKGTVF